MGYDKVITHKSPSSMVLGQRYKVGYKIKVTIPASEVSFCEADAVMIDYPRGIDASGALNHLAETLDMMAAKAREMAKELEE